MNHYIEKHTKLIYSLGYFLLGIYALLLLSLHVLRPEIIPFKDVVSLYGRGEFVYVFIFALFALAFAKGILIMLIPNKGLVTAKVLVFVSAVFTAAIGLFPIGLPGEPQTLTGIMHTVSATMVFGVTVLYSIAFATGFYRHYKDFFRYGLAIAIGNTIGLSLFGVISLMYPGLGERIYLMFIFCGLLGLYHLVPKLRSYDTTHRKSD